MVDFVVPPLFPAAATAAHTTKEDAGRSIEFTMLGALVVGGKTHSIQDDRSRGGLTSLLIGNLFLALWAFLKTSASSEHRVMRGKYHQNQNVEISRLDDVLIVEILKMYHG